MIRLSLATLLASGCLSSPGSSDPSPTDGGGGPGEDGSMSRDGAISDLVDAGPLPAWAGTWIISWSIEGAGVPADCTTIDIAAETLTIDSNSITYSSSACTVPPVELSFYTMPNDPEHYFYTDQETHLESCGDTTTYVYFYNVGFLYLDDTISFDINGGRRRFSDDVSICSTTYHLDGVRAP